MSLSELTGVRSAATRERAGCCIEDASGVCCHLGVATRCVPVGPRSMLSALAADDLLLCIECRNYALLLRARLVGEACICPACPTASNARHARNWEVASSAASTIRRRWPRSSVMASSTFAGGRQRAWTSSGPRRSGQWLDLAVFAIQRGRHKTSIRSRFSQPWQRKQKHVLRSASITRCLNLLPYSVLSFFKATMSPLLSPSLFSVPPLLTSAVRSLGPRRDEDDQLVICRRIS